MSATSDILVIDKFTKRYGQKIAVDNISLKVPRGSFFGLLGPNGAGKSTTIHCITGIGKISSGEITIDGLNVERDYKAARRLVGLSPQDFNVDIFSKPRQLLDYVGGYYGLPKQIRDERIEKLLARFDLLPHTEKQFRELSGGLKRRLILARALVHEPPLLILDEPTAGVDVEQRRSLWTYLRELNQSGTTIILTSHYLEEIEALCDNIAVINHGRIIVHETKAEFTKNGSVEDKYLEITKGDAF